MEENNILEGIEIKKKSDLKSNIIFTVISFVLITVITLLISFL